MIGANSEAKGKPKVAVPAAPAKTELKKLEIHLKRRSFLSGLKKKQQALAASDG